jgi:hypothetical protein
MKARNPNSIFTSVQYVTLLSHVGDVLPLKELFLCEFIFWMLLIQEFMVVGFISIVIPKRMIQHSYIFPKKTELSYNALVNNEV